MHLQSYRCQVQFYQNYIVNYFCIFNFTLEITIVLLLILIFAPNFFKKNIKSLISGSIAQFFKIVFPFAFKDASKAFSVAPTDMDGNLIVFLSSLLEHLQIYIHLLFYFCSKLFNANKCKLL